MTDRETIAPDIHWSCGLCTASGRSATGVDRESMEVHMNDHIAGALEDPVRMIIDVRLPGELPPPGPKMLDVMESIDGWGLYDASNLGTRPVLLAHTQEIAEYVARLWNVDHSA